MLGVDGNRAGGTIYWRDDRRGAIVSTTNKEIGNGQFEVLPAALDFDALDERFELSVKRKSYPKQPIYTLRDFLSPAECQRIIAKCEEMGFQKAGLAIAQDVYRTKEKTRNNSRVMFEDRAMAAQLWQRISHLVDPKFDNHVAWGLNWRFRVYKYQRGDRFAPHVDERMELPGQGLTTLFTFMVYLNDVVEGGETTFFDRRRKGAKKLTVNRVIRPRAGMALAFDHLLFHEGSVVKRGVKYVLRSDLIYCKKRSG